MQVDGRIFQAVDGHFETLAGMPGWPLERLVRAWQWSFAERTRFAGLCDISLKDAISQLVPV
ncbi:hypothetical protein GCT13_46005 [Paraburkholderia sp. CNPSo 3157]|uniref:Uncharacterized protein n=1 Tax=Paraburkholderia franconis TaxID=2654983 RepID=A0A7X1NL33_9BURK|nr:hypothetical protein [Paraburkholderia franconis]MPW23842.1 hypothetical protein [Paraburkholderia franconis]